MATAEVIRDIGLTIQNLLRAEIKPQLVLPENIRVATPDEFGELNNPSSTGISIFLYRISTNASLRNAPKRTLPDGKVARPLLPLELCYLITPWAPTTTDEHVIAGHILQVLYDHAELGASELQGDSWSSDDSVQLVLESLPTDEHYRIWDTTDIPYRLSLTYMARVIGIEPAKSVDPPPVVSASFGRRG